MKHPLTAKMSRMEKSILDNKDIPAEGPAEAQLPGEGPPPALPNVPPFTFIPQNPGGVPAMPPTSPYD